MAQLELFAPASAWKAKRPTAEDVQPDLTSVLDRLRGAEAMPLSAKELKYWRVVFPQMCNWLPPEERASMCAAFAAELSRLEASQARAGR